MTTTDADVLQATDPGRVEVAIDNATHGITFHATLAATLRATYLTVEAALAPVDTIAYAVGLATNTATLEAAVRARKSR